MFPAEKQSENATLNHAPIFVGEEEEEIDVLNADETLGEDDDEQFQPENIFMMGGAEEYDEEGMQYQEGVQFIGQYEDGQQYDGGVLGNTEAYNAHYLDEEYAVRSEEQEFLRRELLSQIEPMTSAQRLEKYPEMKFLPPFRRSMKPNSIFKKPDPNDGPVAKLLYTNFYKRDEEKEAKKKEIVADKLVETQKFMGQQRLAVAKKKVPERSVIRKVARPRPAMLQEPKVTITQLTPLPDRYFVKRLSMTPEQAGFVSECLSCDICHFMVRHKSLLDSHAAKHKKTGKVEVMNPRAGLVCPVKNCTLRSDSIATVIKHLKVAHNLPDFVFERIVFKDMEEFRNWKNELERLTVSKYCRTSGKRNIFSKSTYYQCHHSGGAPPIKPDKVRVRPSKKIGKTCTAFFHVRENDDGTVLLRGCTKHSGHEPDVRNLPLSEEIKMEIATFLIEGFDEASIVDKMRSLSDSKNRRFFLQNYEVRNVAAKIERYKEEYKRKQQNNEPLPNFADAVGERRKELFPVIRAKLACSRFPVPPEPQYVPQVFEEVEVEEEEIVEDTVVEQGEVVIEDGQFNVPSAATVSMPSPAKEAAENVQVKTQVEAVRRSARKATPKKRRMDDEDYQEEEKEKRVEPSPAPIRFSSRLDAKKQQKMANEEIIDVVGVEKEGETLKANLKEEQRKD